MRRAVTVGATDVALLDRLAAEASVARAARTVGISRDRANYRLRRLADAFGGPLVLGRRGGRTHGGSLLTALGERVRRRAVGGTERLRGRPLAGAPPANRMRGTYRVGPPATVELPDGTRLTVAFRAVDGEEVAVTVEPEAILLARGRFPSSARNVLPGTVRAARARAGALARTVSVAVGPTRWAVAVTPATVRGLALAPGRRVYLYLKATAIRRLGGPTRGSRRW
jgi:molybdate transport repressor ModE-like protein/molybdopterin-binding protein